VCVCARIMPKQPETSTVWNNFPENFNPLFESLLHIFNITLQSQKRTKESAKVNNFLIRSTFF
jgi:hypothetical protein